MTMTTTPAAAATHPSPAVVHVAVPRPSFVILDTPCPVHAEPIHVTPEAQALLDGLTPEERVLFGNRWFMARGCIQGYDGSAPVTFRWNGITLEMSHGVGDWIVLRRVDAGQMQKAD